MAETRIDELRRRLERDPGSRLFAQLAEEHRKAGDHAEAIRVARAGLALHPAYPSARLTLGRALLDARDAAAARTELAEVLREAPDNILASRFLGQALEMMGDLAGALKQYAATLKMAPGDRQLEAQVAALRLRAQSGGAVAPEVTAPMRSLAPPLPSAAGVAPRSPAASPAAPPAAARPGPSPAPRPPVPAPPPTERMVPPPGGGERAPAWTAQQSSPSEPTIPIRPAAAPLVPRTPAPAPTPAPAAAPLVHGTPAAAPTPTPGAARGLDVGPSVAHGGRLAEAPVSLSRPLAPLPPAETQKEAPTLPKVVVPDISAFVNTLPPAGAAASPIEAERTPEPEPPAAVPPPVPPPPAEESFDETLDSPAPAPASPTVRPAGRRGSPADTVDGGPPPERPVTQELSPVEWTPPAALDAAAETLSPEESAAPSPTPTPAPLSSSTLAELYLRQGLTERAREVYRQVLAEDPANGRARAGLRDLEAAIERGGPVAERAARRATLQRTIEALEAMLASVRRH